MTIVDRFLIVFPPFQLISFMFLPFYLTPVCLYIFLLRPKRGRRERNDLTEFFWAANLRFFRLFQ